MREREFLPLVDNFWRVTVFKHSVWLKPGQAFDLLGKDPFVGMIFCRFPEVKDMQTIKFDRSRLAAEVITIDASNRCFYKPWIGCTR